MEAQLPEIRRLFDEIEHQVDGFEDSLVLERGTHAAFEWNLLGFPGLFYRRRIWAAFGSYSGIGFPKTGIVTPRRGKRAQEFAWK
jgi:hypothetical protein